MENSPFTEPRAAAPRRRRIALAAGSLAATLAVLGWAAWKLPHRPAPLAGEGGPAFATPYLNTAPEVKYVGDAACASCHPGETDTYRQHPMNQTFRPAAGGEMGERIEGAGVDAFESAGFHYRVERRGRHLFHSEIRQDPQGHLLTKLEAEVRFAVGSGTHGRTYLVERDGFLFSSPISWFAHKPGWGLTPGFQVSEHFGRPAQFQCLFCHCDHAEPVPDTLNRYRLPLAEHGIGCERCHGPGELHVRLRESGAEAADPDPTIVNPGRLEPALRDAVCQQCHLHGESRIERRGRALAAYRPGLPLDQFLAVFIRQPEFTDNHKATSHAEQLAASRCFRDSKGQLGCISCHDPHARPSAEQRVAFYRRRCLSCHGEQSCRLAPELRREQSQADSCIACHMPANRSNIAHTAVTDHRILARAEAPAPGPAASRRLRPGEMPLLPFPRDLADSPDREAARDLGLALTELARDYPSLGKHAAALAVPLLAEAVQARPEDVAAWEAKGYALWLQDRRAEALADLETALRRAPRRETALLYAAAFATELGRTQAATDYWQRAVAVDPWPATPHEQLARLLADQHQWSQAVAECQAALRGNPARVETRVLLVSCLARSGNRVQAGKELDLLLALSPPEERDVLRRWFAEQQP